MAEYSNPFALVLDFTPDLTAQQVNKSKLCPEIAWILYDKVNQQIIKRAHHQINLDTNQPKSQIFSCEYFIEDINKLFQIYLYPEVVVEDHVFLSQLNKNILTPNLQLEKTSHFSVLEDYQRKTDLAYASLEDVLLSLGQTENNQRLTSLTTRTNKILEYYLESIARKEREQPYSRVPREIKTNSFGIWKIICHYFLGLSLMSLFILGLYLLFSNEIITAIIYLMIATVTSAFIFKHLRR